MGKTLAGALAGCLVSVAWGATFGTVVPIGGHVADIALDERRGVLYAANFTANRIEVISLADNTRRTPIFVAPQPGSIALSPGERYLVVGHYANWGAPNTLRPSVTVLDLDAGLRQNLAMGSSPLAIAFGAGSQALIVTNKDFLLLDPETGIFTTLDLTDLSSTELPVPFATFPPEIIQASAGVSGDGETIYVLAQGNERAAVVRYSISSGLLSIVGISATPELGPRVISVNRDGSAFLAGWGLFTPQFTLLAQFPYPSGKLNIGSHIVDSSRNLIYAHMPVGAAPTPTPEPTTPTTPTPTPPPTNQQPAAPPEPPVLTILDSDNLTVRERFQLRESLAGKSLLRRDLQVMYAASDSGVTVLPIGSLDRAPRVVALQEDLVFRSNACDRRVILQDLDVVDPGGGSRDFTLSTTAKGIRIFPSSGTTPARVRVEVDPTVYQNQKGTVAVSLEIKSRSAVNLPMPVRLLINTREPDQRGAFFNLPGKLVDILADPVRDRFYVLRQDKNLVLIFDGTSFDQTAALRTGNTPVQMAITNDFRFLIVTNDNSQIANVYNLDSLQPQQFIEFPKGHYPRSIAVSNRAILVASRTVNSAHTIDRVEFDARIANELPSLGIYANEVSEDTVLAASPTKESVFIAMPDGNLLLYEANADTFVASRQDFTELSGAYAALTDELFIADNKLVNWSLVPLSELETNTGSSSGFVFWRGYGLRTTSPSAVSPGVIQRVDLSTFNAVRPTRMVESPLLAASLETPPVGQIGQTILPFTRTLAPLANGASIVSLTTSGFTVLPWDFDRAVATPLISRIVNIADETEAVAPGGLISIFGSDLSAVTAVNKELPIPTTLGEVCVSVNNVAAPLSLVSPNRINAQLPFTVVGGATMVVRAPGGISSGFQVTILPGAAAVFRTGTAGPETGIATVFRAVNNELVTLANPVHPRDYLLIFATGLGTTSPAVESGAPGPADPLAAASSTPRVTLGGVALQVTFAGLVPGEVGVYQINAFVPETVPTGMQVPLKIEQGTYSTTLMVRVVK